MVLIGADAPLIEQALARHAPHVPVHPVSVDETDGMSAGADHLAEHLMDAVVDRYFPIIDMLETELETIEEQIFSKARGAARSNIERMLLGMTPNASDVPATFRQYARDADGMGLHLEISVGREVRERFPYLSTEVKAVSLAPQDGHANPRLAAPAFARAARARGVAVRENTVVTAIGKSGEDFRVATAEGEWRAPLVLVATGAWAGPLCEALGEPVPLEVRSPQMGVTEPTNHRIHPTHDVSTTHRPEALYFRQVKRGNIVFGGCASGPADPVAGRSRVLPESTLLQLPQLRRLVPALGRLNVIRVWGGIESYLPDTLPIVGPSLKWPGLYYAFGFCGHGFQTGPGVGDAMAELMATGATATRLGAYSLARFRAVA